MALTPEHEGLHRIFAQDPAMLASVMTQALGCPMPAPAAAELLNVDHSDFLPVLERRSDTVLLVRAGPGDPGGDFILIVESQTDPDETRRAAWPYYLAYLHDKYQLPVLLLVVCSKAATARWARQPVTTGARGLTCQVTTPVVLGPQDVPVITTAAQAARDLHFAVFAAFTHSRGPQARVILEALAAALETDPGNASSLSEFTEAGLGGTPGREIWKALMATGTYTYVSETRAKGRAEGHADYILRALEHRGITVDDDSRARIQSCTEQATLDTWFDRTFDARTVEDLFKE